jgi:uncharacterized membrane protein
MKNQAWPVSCRDGNAAPGDVQYFSPVTRSSSLPAAITNTRWLAVGSLLALIVLGLAWELWLAPLRPGGSWLALKVLPLTIPLSGLLKERLYTYRWASLLVWLYFTEGVVRAWSDMNDVSEMLALVQVALCLTLFVACALHVRLRLRHASRTRKPEGVSS